MTFDQIIRDLKNKVFHPIYFLQGDEPYFIDVISNYIANNVLEEHEREFNQVVLYGRESDPSAIVEAAKRYPMMANHQVIIVKEAQGIRKIEQLESYVQQPLSSTILVFCYKYKKLDKRKTFSKVLAKSGVIFDSKKLYENQIPGWIQKHLSERGHNIHPRASALLTEYLGTDLSKMANELEKLMLNVPEGVEINVEHIEENIGISKDYNTFELQEAIGKRDHLKVGRISQNFARNPKGHPFVVTISTLHSYFTKILQYHYLKDKSSNNVASVLRINPYFVRQYQEAAGHFSARKVVDIISRLREYDLKSKGVGNASAKDGELLKELLFQIMH